MQPNPARTAARVICAAYGYGYASAGRLGASRTGLLVLAVAAGALAKAEADADRDATQLYVHRHALLHQAAQRSPAGGWFIGPHAWARPGITLKPGQAGGQTVVQFFTGCGMFSFHYLEPVEQVAARFAPANVAAALAGQPGAWDGIALQPIARALLQAYLRHGAAGVLRARRGARAA
jgi:hypothetical protein